MLKRPNITPEHAVAAIAALAISATANAQFAGFDFSFFSLDALNNGSPTGVTAADFDRDGDIDIAFSVSQASSGLDDVVIRFNDGNATFGPPVSLPVGDDPRAIESADLDGDGDTDIVVTNQGTEDLSVLLNRGDGTFDFEIIFPTTGPCEGLAIGDFTDDGVPDIVSTNNTSNGTVDTWVGDGDGTFSARQTWSVANQDTNFGDGPVAVSLADINRDGFPDIVTANRVSDSVTILFNDFFGPPGTFSQGDFARFIDGLLAVSDLTTGDIDGDNDDDIIVANVNASGAITIIENTPTFPFPITVIPSSNNTRSIDLADLDGLTARADGDLDVVAGTNSGLDVFLNDGNANLNLQPQGGFSFNDAALADFDGDGDIDVIGVREGFVSVSLFLNNRNVLATDPPIVTLVDPDDTDCLCTGATPIFGSVQTPVPMTLESYTLRARRIGSDTFSTIALGDSTFTDASPFTTWDTTGLAPGLYLLQLVATTSGGASATDEAVVRIDDDQFGGINIKLARGIGPAGVGTATIVGRSACIFGSIDDDGCGGTAYFVEYQPATGGQFLAVDPANPIYTGDRINNVLATWDTIALNLPDGQYNIRVEAVNACGNTEVETIEATVDNTAPIADITEPTNCKIFTPGEPIEIFGTVFDENLSSWSIQYTGGDTNGWVTIASGNSNIQDGLLAIWDTSGLPACAYTLRLRASDSAVLNCDGGGNSAGTLVSIDLRCLGDTNNSGTVTAIDISNVLSQFGRSCP